MVEWAAVNLGCWHDSVGARVSVDLGRGCLARETIICAGRSAASSNVAALIAKASYVQIEVATGCGSDLGWASSARGLDLRLIEP